MNGQSAMLVNCERSKFEKFTHSPAKQNSTWTIKKPAQKAGFLEQLFFGFFYRNFSEIFEQFA